MQKHLQSLGIVIYFTVEQCVEIAINYNIFHLVYHIRQLSFPLTETKIWLFLRKPPPIKETMLYRHP